MNKFICQMYGLRKEFEKDYDATIQKMKEIGFDAVQLDGMRGNNPQAVAKSLQKHGLEVCSMHIKHDRFIFDVEGIIEEGILFNCKEVYCKYIEDEFQVEYGYKFTKYALIKAAKKLVEAGFHVGLHSPEYDFNTLVDGKKVMDYICEEEDGICIHPEPDTYWLSVAQVDPLTFIKQYPNRILTIHMKDIDTSKDLMDMKANLVECGKGVVDYPSIIKWGEENGVKCYAIEQDYANGDMFDSMKESLMYLTRVYTEVTGKALKD